jgi:hypothetical protein
LNLPLAVLAPIGLAVDQVEVVHYDNAASVVAGEQADHRDDAPKLAAVSTM